MITENYREAEAKWLIGATITLPQVIALGTGDAGEISSAYALDEEYYRKTIDFRWSPKRFAARFGVNLLADMPPPLPGSASITFTEIGLFDGVVISLVNPDFEIWSGSPAVPSNWTLSGTAASWAQSSDQYEGSYAVEITSGGGTAYAYQDAVLSRCRGKVVTLKAPVKTSSGSVARIGIDDGSDISYTPYHSGGGAYEILEITKNISSAATRARMILEVGDTGSAKFDWLQCYQRGKLWARSIISQSKQAGVPVVLSWEISSEEEQMVREAYEMEELTPGTSSAGSLDPSKYAQNGQVPASAVQITVEDQDIRYWIHGGTPDASAGHRIGSANPLGGVLIEGANNIANLRFIALGGTAKMKVSYLR